MFKLTYKDMVIEYHYDHKLHHYNGKVVNIDEHIQHTSPSLSEMKNNLFNEIDVILKFNHKNGF